MKRVIFSITGTIAGLVALLSFKTHGTPVRSLSGLPSAALSTSQPATASQSGTDTAPASTSSSSSGTAPAPAATSSAAATSRTTTGRAISTRYGIVQVRVVTSGSKITDVSFVQLTAFDRRSQEINSAAAPILLQETLSAQSARIDTVSGATYTSDGYVQSLQGALDQAGVR